jgi:nicotinate-nucleotide adenylyltransferase
VPIRLGLFGGTFDPPHLGHQVVATQARELLELDHVLWMVANDPWQKTGERSPSPAAARLEMVGAAVEDLEGQVACSMEVDRGGPTYTYDTVVELKRVHPDAEIVVVLGRDTAAGLPGWHRADELRSLARIAYVERPGSEGLQLPPGWNVERLEVPVVGISSTEMRSRLADGRPIVSLVRPQVVTVARRHGLYRGTR